MLPKLGHLVKRRLIRLEDRLRKSADLGTERRRRCNGPAVFIIGAPFSGAELVCSILNRHSRIACASQTLFLAYLLISLKDKNCSWGLRSLGVSHDSAVADIRAFALNYYERYLYVCGKSRWVDSTSCYTPFAPVIYEVFAPDVRFIHLVRNGMDVVPSIVAAGGIENELGHWTEYFHQEEKRNSSPLDQLHIAASYWQTYTRLAEHFARYHPYVCHSIRFEQLSANPEPTLRSLFEFLGEKWEPGLLEGIGSDTLADGQSAIHSKENMAAHEDICDNWSVDNQRLIHKRLAADLERYGYDETCP